MTAASWIWADVAGPFICARREMTLEAVPDRWLLDLTCGQHYRLWVNGRFAARGPMRGHPRRKFLDTLDLAPFLRPGANVLALRLINDSEGTAWTGGPLGPPVLWLHAHDGSLASDRSWRFRQDPCFLQDAAFRSRPAQGRIEVFDGAREDGWMEAGYDDGAWASARPQPGLVSANGAGDPRNVAWYERLLPRPLPMPTSSIRRPTRVVRVAEVIEQEWVPRGGHLGTLLLMDLPLPTEHTRVVDADGLCRGEPCTLAMPDLDADGAALRSPTIILDCGAVTGGHLAIDVEGPAGAIVDIAWGEELIAGRVQAIIDVSACCARYVLRQGRQRHELHHFLGLRYLQLTVRRGARIVLHAVEIQETHQPLPGAGAFACADAVLDPLWRAGERTMRLCMQDRMMSDLTREQAEWLGDSWVGCRIALAAWGSADAVRHYLETACFTQFPSGQLPQVTLAEWQGAYIVDWSLYWVLTLGDLHAWSSDASALRRFLPYLVRLLDWFDPYIDGRGLLVAPPGWIFIDWMPVDRRGACSILNALLHMALAAGARLAHALGHVHEASAWQARADGIAAAFHAAFWDADRGLYRDSDAGPACSEHAQAIAVHAGLAVGDPAALLRRTLLQEDLLRTQPFFAYHLLEALARAGLHREALATMRSRWVATVASGDGTVWEEWRTDRTLDGGGGIRHGHHGRPSRRWLPHWRSHAHPWGGGPTAWLSRHILGVRPEGDGGWLVAPEPGDLDHAAGSVPTPCGPVTISWSSVGGRIALRLAVPPGLPCTLRLPSAWAGRVDVERT